MWLAAFFGWLAFFLTVRAEAEIASAKVPPMGIYHRARPAKKDAKSLSHIDMNDDDITEQIDVYGAADEASFVSVLFDKNCSVPNTSYFVSRKQIEDMGARNLLDIIKIVPGFDVSRDISGYFMVSSRGLREDARMKLLIDGRSAQNTYSGRNFWQIPADLIEQVDVLLGPNSVEFGSGALNGVVNVIMRRQNGIVAHAYGGGFSTYVGSLATGKKIAETENFLNVQIEAEDGPKIAIEGDRFSERRASGQEGDLLTHAQRIAFSAAVSSDVLLSRALDARLGANAQFFLEQRGPYIGAFDTSGPNSKLFWLMWKADIGLRIPYATANALELRIYADQNAVSNLYQITPSKYVIDDNIHPAYVFDEGILFSRSYRTLTLGGEIKNTLRLFSNNELKASGNIDATGLLLDSFAFAMNRTLEGGPQPLSPINGLNLAQNLSCNPYGGHLSPLFGACRITFSAMLLDEWQVERPLKLFAGLRLASFSDVEFDWWSHLNPKAGIVITPDRNWMIKFLFASGLRLPTFKEKYDQTSRAFVSLSPGQFVGNELLKAEVARTIEANILYREFYNGVKYSIDGTGYVSIVSNATEEIDIKGDLNSLNNNGGYYVFGAEGSAEAHFRDGSNIFFNIGWFRSYWREFDDKGMPTCQVTISAANGNKGGCTLITNLPQLRANAGINLSLGNIGFLNLTTELGSERRNNARSDLERQRQFRIGPYALFNASFRSRLLFDHFILHASVFNAFNFVVKDDAIRPDNMPGLIPREGPACYVGISVVM